MTKPSTTRASVVRKRGVVSKSLKKRTSDLTVQKRKELITPAKDPIDEMMHAPGRGVAYSENVILTNGPQHVEENKKLGEMMLFMLADDRKKAAMCTDVDSNDSFRVSTIEYLVRLNEHAPYFKRAKSNEGSSYKIERFFYSSFDSDVVSESTTNASNGEVPSVSQTDVLDESDDKVFENIDTEELEIECFFNDFFASRKVSPLNDTQLNSIPTLHDVVVALDKRNAESRCQSLAIRALRSRYVSLNNQFVSKRGRIVFVPSSHRYYVCGKEMKLSVTKALDLIFGAFDEDLVTSRMIRSTGWKRNKLYKRFNYDETGAQRSEAEIKKLILNEWREKRDRGTILHDYINKNYTKSERSLSIRESSSSSVSSTYLPRSLSPLVASSVRVSTSSVAREEQSHKRNEDVPVRIGGSTAVSTNTSTGYRASDGRTLREILMVDGDSSHNTDGLKLPKTSVARDVTSDEKKNNDLVLESESHRNLLDTANVEAFDKWNHMVKRNNWLLVASEYSLCYERAGLAGTIDAIFLPYVENPNILVLVDWKRCPLEFSRYSSTPYEHPYTKRLPKCNYWKYAFQLNVYREMVERTFKNVTVMDMLLVNFLPEDRFPRYYSVPRLHEARLFLDDLVVRNKSS